jgi:hypothetical protein
MSNKIKILALVVLLSLSTTAFGTLLMEENFNYTVGTALTATGNWTAHSGPGTRPILVTTPGLTYTGYVSSGIGEATTYNGGSSGEDINRAFGSNTSGTIYVAAMINVNAAVTTNDYFFHLGPNTMGTAYVGRVHVKQDGSGNVAFGIGKGSSDTIYTGFTYALNTTYLLVLKYEIISGTTNDIVSLFIFTSGAPTNEPGTPTLGPQSPASTDPVDIGSVGLRQATQAYAVQVDGIRVGTTWTDVLPGTGTTPTKLVIISFNGGVDPSANTPFNVVIQSQDDLGNIANVTNNTDISLSLAAGTGILGGTLTGTIPASQNSVTISGVIYNTAETGVKIAATRTSGDVLAPDTTDPFTVYAAASQLAFVNVPAAGQVGNVIGTFMVEARRPDNSVDLNYTDNVIIGKTSGPGSMTGTVMKYCVAGVATFNDIEFDASGSYEIGATAAGLTGATSSSINILAITFPLIENFEYTSGTSLVYNGWSAHSGAGSVSLMVTTPGLTYSGYLSSGIGEATTVNGGSGTREDAHRIFSAQTGSNTYAAFMVYVDTATGSWDYFAHFGPQSIGTSFKGKLLVKIDATNNLQFGLAKTASTSPIDSTGYVYTLNTTYLIVMKYSYIDGADNDIVSLWINPSLTGPEPTPDLTAADGGDLVNVGAFALRQGSQAYSIIVDGIRVGDNWGIVNGSFPPSISDVTRTPNIPFDGDVVNVSAKIYDAVTTLGSILDTLYYAVNNQISWTAVLKDSFHASDSLFFYTIPAVTMDAQGDTVFYQIAATDGDGNRATSSGFRYMIPLERTVAQIQGSSPASPDTHNYVHTSGIVTGVFGNRFFMEQRPGGAWNGIYVYRGVADNVPAVSIGDSVDVVGVVAEYSTLTEINANASSLGAVEVMGNVALPCTTLLTITTLAEDYESDLIKIENLHFNVTGTFTQETNYWVVNNTGTESLRIRIDSTAFGIVGQAIPTTEIPVIGCLSQYKDTFQLFPRVITDLYASYLDVGVTEVIQPAGSIVQGSIVTPQAKVKNFGNQIAPAFDVIFTITELKQGNYCDTVNVAGLDIDEELTVSFENYYAGGEVGYFYGTEAKTELTGDMYAPNNSLIGGGFEIVEAVIGNWAQKESVPKALDIKANKYIKDGGALVGVDDEVYVFHGNKSWQFYKYTPGAVTPWSTLCSIPMGLKYKPGVPLDSTKWNKKKVGKGAALCADTVNKIIYATKGNSTYEFFAYDIATNTWSAKAFLPTIKAPKVGTSIAYLGGYVYLLAGGLKNTDIFFKYDIAGDSWMTLANPIYGVKPWKAGSAITEFGGKIYAMKGGEKPNYFVNYDPATGWIIPNETLTTYDSVWSGSVWKSKKVYLKDGAAIVSTGDAMYAIKGGGKHNFFSYTPATGWVQLQTDTIPRLTKKSVPKTGAALAYANDRIWLIKGNNCPEFWSYGPVTKKANINEPVSKTNTNIQTDGILNRVQNEALVNIYPNPMQSHTQIRYSMPSAGYVSIRLYNATGSLVKTVYDGYQAAGEHTLNLSNIASGIYFLKYEANHEKSEIKLIVQ